MKSLVVVWALSALSLVVTNAFASERINVRKDFDSLGGNEAIVQRAKALDPKNKVEVVQNRLVDRNLRLELGINYGIVGGGDSYYSSQNLGGNLDFHINPKWSVGVRYERYYNSLTAEGRNVYDNAAAQMAMHNGYSVFPVDYPVESGLFVVNWYPFYGKLNLFDLGVAHFDLYTIGGYGKINLSSGWTDTYAAGGGIGLWLSQHLATRFEVRYQTYTDRVNDAPRRLDTIVGMASVGILL